ncbi:MAG: hypothetical protein LBV54_06530, partial [Puniceicoccales bacterium]|nr:hypothetical protein [Puniceicoccales bacterium]
MKRASLLFIFALLLFPATGFAQAALEAFEAKTFTLKSGYKLQYRLLQPEKIEPGKKYPIVL